MSDLDIIAGKYCAGAMPIPLEAADRLLWQGDFNAWPIMKQLGMRLALTHPELVQISIEKLHAYHRGGAGDASNGGGMAVNGAVLAGMFDAALGVAGVLQLLKRRAATVDLSIKMFRPVLGCATAFGWAVRKGASVVFTEAVVLNPQGVRCAHASGIVCASDSPGPADRAVSPIVSEACSPW